VRSQRGCEGGYWLARDAASIRVRDAIIAVDGALLSIRGEPRADLDYRGTAESLTTFWADIETNLDAIFSATTIADLLDHDRKE
jgi:DNA-binding IscR family transcriptional regulator